jgi:hypothetical protein
LISDWYFIAHHLRRSNIHRRCRHLRAHEFRCFKKFALIELFDLITYVDAQARS